MLSKETRKLLKSVTGISTSAVIEYPITGVMPQDKSVIAFVDLSDYEEPFEKFGSYFMNEMLAVIDFFEDPEVTLKDDVLEIVGKDGRCMYETTDITIIEKKFYIPPEKFQAMKNAENAATFHLKKEDLAKISKLSGLLKLNHVVIDFLGDEFKFLLTNFTDFGKYQTPAEINIEIEDINKKQAQENKNI